MFNPGITDNLIGTHAPIHRYAWLEHERGMWHFLTHLFADPAKSTRRWSDKQLALEELMSEGWSIVYPYPEQPQAKTQTPARVCGYGLMWTDQ
jgi:hypothetical protein